MPLECKPTWISALTSLLCRSMTVTEPSLAIKRMGSTRPRCLARRAPSERFVPDAARPSCSHRLFCREHDSIRSNAGIPEAQHPTRGGVQFCQPIRKIQHHIQASAIG